MGDIALVEYTGRVVNVDPPAVGRWGSIRIPCRHCLEMPMNFIARYRWLGMAAPIVELHDALWSDSVTRVVVWMGRCPRCGTVHQTWLVAGKA